MHEEFENTRAPWNNTIPGYFGFGYVSLEFEVQYALFVSFLYIRAAMINRL